MRCRIGSGWRSGEDNGGSSLHKQVLLQAPYDFCTPTHIRTQ